MNLKEIMDIEELSETEQDIIVSHFSTPLVRRYLKKLAQADIANLANLPAMDETDRQLAMAHSQIQGGLNVYLTLLSIGNPK